jgi:hypothetical protein
MSYYYKFFEKGRRWIEPERLPSKMSPCDSVTLSTASIQEITV